jgi:hypothetical protein
MSTIENILNRVDACIDMHPDLFLARVQRYDGRTDDNGKFIPAPQFGWHLYEPSAEGWAYLPLVHHTLGLLGEEDDHRLRLALDIKRGMEEINPADIKVSACSRFPEGTPLLRFVVHSACPIQFHSQMDAGDPDTLARLKVYTTATVARTGASHVWAYYRSLDELTELRQRVLSEREGSKA